MVQGTFLFLHYFLVWQVPAISKFLFNKGVKKKSFCGQGFCQADVGLRGGKVTAAWGIKEFRKVQQKWRKLKLLLSAGESFPFRQSPEPCLQPPNRTPCPCQCWLCWCWGMRGGMHLCTWACPSEQCFTTPMSMMLSPSVCCWSTPWTKESRSGRGGAGGATTVGYSAP